jgi:transposase
LWFYAGYLLTSTRCGISAKQLEREIGVTYKTAWRMLNKLRTIAMADDSGPLSGDVEVDEASVDGRPRKKQGQRELRGTVPNRRSEAAKLRERSRATVFAAVERGGRIKATVLPSRHGPGLKRQVIEWVEPTSIIITDDWGAYKGLERHFIDHSRINHSAGMYVEGSTHTNTVEGFFGHLKPSIKGTYRKVVGSFFVRVPAVVGAGSGDPAGVAVGAVGAFDDGAFLGREFADALVFFAELFVAGVARAADFVFFAGRARRF